VCKKYFRRQARDAYINDKDRIENAPIAHSFSNYATGGANKRPFVPRIRDDASGIGEPGEIIEPVKKEYIDFDDPMTAQLREMKKQIAFGTVPKQERQ